MCTDDMAIDHLERTLQIEGLNIWDPRPEQIKDLKPEMIKPQNVGDSHIRLMLKKPKKYGIAKELVENFLTAFYSIL